jgi:hypothetical protein
MNKYNKASIAAVVTAVAAIAEWAFDKDIPTAVIGAVTTIAVFLIPNATE